MGFLTTTGTNFDSLVLPVLMTGIGISFVFTPLLVAVMGAVKPVDSPKAGAFISLALNLGGSVASASLVALIDRRESFHGSVVTGHATLANPAVAEFVSHFGLARLGVLLARESAALAYADTFFVLGLFAIVLAPLAFALPRRRRSA
jgi:DHA2 family multidrug resistance protein